MSGIALVAYGLKLAFGSETVVDVPNLRAAPGSLTVLAGPSGSGKSSLLYLLSGLLLPSAGSVSWGGSELTQSSERGRDRWRRRHAGFIFQDFQLIEEMSPLDNVLGPVWFDQFSAASHRGRALALLEQLAVPHQRAEVGQLSRGQKQRVAIARALIRDPDVVFADEPTASLDAVAGQSVIDILRGLALEQGRIVIAATHDPQLRAGATAIVALEHGHPVQTMEPA